MDKLKIVQTDLETARKDFQALSSELPQFQTLVAENETEAEKLRKTRADLSKQAEAKGRVSVAREMLEQHQSDIATAQAEVVRLEIAVKRESALVEIFTQAELTQKHRAAIDTQLVKASRLVERYVQRCLEEYDSLQAARQAFQAVNADDDLKRRFKESGGKLAKGVNADSVSISDHPEPYGAAIWKLVDGELYKRAATYHKQREAARSARLAAQKPLQPKVVKIRVAEPDAPTVLRNLGDLALRATLIKSGEVNTISDVDITVFADDLENAKQLLKGALSYDGYTVERA